MFKFMLWSAVILIAMGGGLLSDLTSFFKIGFFGCLIIVILCSLGYLGLTILENKIDPPPPKKKNKSLFSYRK